MKTLVLANKSWAIGMLLGSLVVTQAFAKSGESSGGGDLCEDRIKVIRDDLKSWIQNGGPNGLTLPRAVSTAQYSDAMLAAIDSAKVRCVGAKDEGYPVTVNGTPKVCRFDQDNGASSITCDVIKFTVLSESDQYVLVHHEFAGLAAIEPPNGDDSQYQVSNQISEYLVNKTIKVLAVKKPVSSAPIVPAALVSQKGTYQGRSYVGYVNETWGSREDSDCKYFVEDLHSPVGVECHPKLEKTLVECDARIIESNYENRFGKIPEAGQQGGVLVKSQPSKILIRQFDHGAGKVLINTTFSWLGTSIRDGGELLRSADKSKMGALGSLMDSPGSRIQGNLLLESKIDGCSMSSCPILVNSYTNLHDTFVQDRQDDLSNKSFDDNEFGFWEYAYDADSRTLTIYASKYPFDESPFMARISRSVAVKAQCL